MSVVHFQTDDLTVELLPGRLTFWASEAVIAGTKDERNADGYHFFALTPDFHYEPFANDFGPYKLSMVHQFCLLLHEKLQSPDYKGMNIVLYSSLDPKAMANAACLLCMYLVIARGTRADEAFQPFSDANAEFRPFRDAASSRRSTFDLTILDCLQGMQRAIQLGWFDWSTFDVETYEAYDGFDDYGMNWLIPGKLMAFAGPGSSSVDRYGEKAFVPQDYVPLFRAANVELVIRLNNKEYDSVSFTKNNIRHMDLFFDDGSCPSESIISQFMKAVETTRGAVAVHCKAGLGRTGTLIALYAMKHYQFPAKQFIGWSRICRPGCILGGQQHFLVDMEAAYLRHDTQVRPSAPRGRDEGQGERLCEARKGSKSSTASVDKFRKGSKALPVLLRRIGICVEEVKHETVVSIN